MTDLKKARARAWVTRRRKYGPRGNRGAYARSSVPCAHCLRMQRYLIGLHVDGFISEGQAARVTGLDRVAVRTIADEILSALA